MPKTRQVFDKIVAILEQDGFKIRRTKSYLKDLDRNYSRRPDVTVSNPKRFVRMTIAVSSDCVYGQVKLQNNIGNYRLAGEFRHTDNAYIGHTNGQRITQDSFFARLYNDGGGHNKTEQDFYDWFKELRGSEATDKLRSKADLAPLRFTEQCVEHRVMLSRERLERRIEGTASFIMHFYKYVACVGIVGVTKKLVVTSQTIDSPNEECWFHMRGRTTSGHMASIIVNHDFTKFHPLGGGQKIVVSNNYCPDRGFYDFRNMTSLDRDAAMLAVEEYLSQL